MISFLNQKAKARHVAGLSYFAIMILMTGSAFAQSDSARLNRLENDIQTLNRAVYKGEMPPASSVYAGSGGSNAAASEVRIQQLEGELQKLTGQIEEQNFKIKQMEQQLQRFTEDMNMRMNDIEGNGGGAAAGSTTGVNRASQYIARTTSSSSTVPPTAEPVINNTVTTVSGAGTTTSGTTGYQWSSGAPGVEVNAAATGDNPASIYENAYTLMKNNDYAGAEKGFQTFLDANPDHPLAGNAKYWLGETFYVRNDYKNAARVFAEAYQQYPKNSKAADNLLKLGMALASMGKKDDACVAFSQLKKEYAGKADSVVKRADQEISNLGCK